jgi:hypothetical protein
VCPLNALAGPESCVAVAGVRWGRGELLYCPAALVDYRQFGQFERVPTVVSELRVSLIRIEDEVGRRALVAAAGLGDDDPTDHQRDDDDDAG